MTTLPTLGLLAAGALAKTLVDKGITLLPFSFRWGNGSNGKPSHQELREAMRAERDAAVMELKQAMLNNSQDQVRLLAEISQATQAIAQGVSWLKGRLENGGFRR